MTPLLALQSHYLTGRLRLKSSSKYLLIDLDTPLSPRQDLVRLQNQIFGFKKKLETSVQLSWKVLLTEAKTRFGIQKCKVRVCRIMKIAINKARCYRKIRVNLMHVNLTFEKFALFSVTLFSSGWQRALLIFYIQAC